MNLRGKPTKTEWLLAAVAVIFFVCLAALALWGGTASTGTVVSVERQAEWEYVPAPAEKVDINTADEEGLAELPGIGPVLAGRIVEYRESNGPFGSADELMEIEGIGPKILEGLRDQISIQSGEADR